MKDKVLLDEKEFLIELENLINKDADKKELIEYIYQRHRKINKLINKDNGIDN